MKRVATRAATRNAAAAAAAAADSTRGFETLDDQLRRVESELKTLRADIADRKQRLSALVAHRNQLVAAQDAERSAQRIADLFAQRDDAERWASFVRRYNQQPIGGDSLRGWTLRNSDEPVFTHDDLCLANKYYHLNEAELRLVFDFARRHGAVSVHWDSDGFEWQQGRVPPRADLAALEDAIPALSIVSGSDSDGAFVSVYLKRRGPSLSLHSVVAFRDRLRDPTHFMHALQPNWPLGGAATV